MPYTWLDQTPNGDVELRLWPHRSLSRHGFVWFIGLTSALIGVPLIGLIGKSVLWGVLPFLVAAIAAVWMALRKSERDRDILEVLTLARGRAHLARFGPNRRQQEWEANPYWIEVCLHATGGPVANYLTLRGGPREVEIGAFLTEDERKMLQQELSGRIARISRATFADPS